MPASTDLGITDVTALVRAVGSGDAEALRTLFSSVYDELKRLAHRQLAASPNPTINTTGLVHEAYLKLINPQGLRLNDRGHFFATAARAMRQIVVDHARRRLADKRGNAVQAVTLDDQISADALEPMQLVHLDDALGRLQQLEPRLAELVEMRFFAGLSVEQVAELREVAPRTVIRDWRRARAYLFDSVNSSAN
jgi:RNA polymerase sigma factor (TIGR02999 family)